MGKVNVSPYTSLKHNVPYKSVAFKQIMHQMKKWTTNGVFAECISEAVLQGKNILIIGTVGSGKAMLLNDLIQMNSQKKKFRYIYRSMDNEISSYALSSELQSCMEYSINLQKEPFHMIKRGLTSDNPLYWAKPDLFVVDDIPRQDLMTITHRLQESCIPAPVLATFMANKQDDLNFINVYVKKFFDLIIILQSYQDISHVLLK